MVLGVSTLVVLSKDSPSDNPQLSISSPTRPLRSIKQQLLMMNTTALRFGTPILILVILIIMLASQAPHHKTFLPVVEIDTSTMDMFAGMYGVLGDSFTENDDLGQGLSTSAILIMSNLTSILMGSLPDQISSSFTTTCFSTTNHYRYTDDQAPRTDEATLVLPYGVNQGNFNFTNVTVECKETTLFDYRAILYDNGFYYMLSFADKDPVSDEDYDQYQNAIDKKNTMINRVPSMLIFVIVAQAFSLGITFYHRVISRKNDSSVTVRVLNQVMAIGTLIVCLVDTVATVVLTKIFIEIKNMASSDFQAFGVKIELCVPWFSLLWVVMACCVFTSFSWVGPVWCAAPDEDEFEEESGKLLTTMERTNTATSTMNNPFESPFDFPIQDQDHDTYQHPTPTTKTPEMGYDSEFGATSTYTKEDEESVRFSKTRPIL